MLLDRSYRRYAQHFLPQKYICLGAYSSHNNVAIHRTRRKGTPKFNHNAFSRIYLDNHKENFQLHTWEYLITDELTGYVVTKNKSDLSPLQKIEGYGCKLGKEGYGVVTEIEIIKLEEKTIEAIPSTIVPMEALLQTNQFINGCDIYNLYKVCMF